MEIISLYLLGIIIGYCTIFGIGIVISAYLRYRVKKTPVTRALLLQFIFILCAVISSLVTVFFANTPLCNALSFEDFFGAANPEKILILANTFFYQLVVVFMLLAVYYTVVFAQLVFAEGKSLRGTLMKLIKVVILITVVIQLLVNALLLYSITSFVSGFPLDQDLITLTTIDIPSLVSIIQLGLYLFIQLTIFVGAIKVRRRLPAEDPHRVNLLYLTIMTFFYVLMMGLIVVDTILLQSTEYPTIAFFIVWICVSVALYSGYRGYFSIKSGGS